MIADRMRKVSTEIRNRWGKLVSIIKPYEPMEHGKEILDAQYQDGTWSYLRSIEEAPRFGIVSAYCRKLGGGGAILEIGCGDGILLEQLDRSRYSHFTGIDISSVAIGRTVTMCDGKTEFVCAEAESYTPDRTFDVVVFNEVLEYFDDPLAVVARYERYTVPAGHFIVSMFSGLDTARTRLIWKRLHARYRLVASARVSTQRSYVWNIRAFRAHDQA